MFEVGDVLVQTQHHAWYWDHGKDQFLNEITPAGDRFVVAESFYRDSSVVKLMHYSGAKITISASACALFFKVEHEDTV